MTRRPTMLEAIAGLACLALFGCGDRTADHDTRSGSDAHRSHGEITQPAEASLPGADHGAMDHAHMGHEALPPADVVPGASLHQLDVAMTSQAGETVTWGDLGDGPVLVAMIYSSCTTACPMIVAEVQRIRKEADSDARVLLITMDPARDTPAALTAMKERHSLDDRWTLVHSDDAGTRMLAAALGVRYRKLPSGDFNHSQVVALLDGKGVIVARAEGLGSQRDRIVSKLKGM